MARAIMELCDLSDKERHDMGMRGHEYVMKYHSVPVLVDRLLGAIEGAMLDQKAAQRKGKPKKSGGTQHIST